MDFLEDMSVDDSFSDDDELKSDDDDMSDFDPKDLGSPKNDRTQSLQFDPQQQLVNKGTLEHKNTDDGLIDDGPKSTKMRRLNTEKIVDHKVTANEEIEKLKKQLLLSNNQIEILRKAKHVSSAQTDFNCHLAFMFASPLVRKISKNLGTILQLDYKSEITKIEKAFKNFKHELKYKMEVATINNFRSMIADPPFALHFTGHGIENNKQSLGSVHTLYKDKGDILLMEDENWMAEYLFEKDLAQLLEIEKASRDDVTYNYEVVFVSSWHSQCLGLIFQKFGAHHVICIQKSDTILDKASLRFSKVFYETLFMKRYSVWEAFNIAKNDIKSLFSADESRKYLLLTNDKHPVSGKKNKFEHKWFPVLDLKAGKLTNLNPQPLFNKIPSQVENFWGRQKEICQVIKLLNENRLVNILGPPGIGKTALSWMVWNNLYDRRRFYDGIIYLSLRGLNSTQELLLSLLNVIQECIGSDEEEMKNYNRQISINSNFSSGNDIDPEVVQNRKIIFQCLKNKEALIILDGCESLLDEEGKNFKNLLDSLLFQCPDIKLLLTSRKFIETLEHFHENSHNLSPLEPQYATRLLLDSVNRNISVQEIQELFQYRPPKGHVMNQLFSHLDPSDMNLTNHPLTVMLGGHPQAISLTAPWLEHLSLTELFEKLMDTNLLDLLENAGKQSYASLRASVDFLIEKVKKENIKALDLFKFIGLFPEGLNQVDLAKLWENNEWKTLKFDLLRSSMIIYKEERSMLALLPIMMTRAIELLDKNPKKKARFHVKWCKFYKNFLTKYLEKVNNKDFKKEDFLSNERNIWAWIYRAINKKKATDDYDEVVNDKEDKPAKPTLIRFQTVKVSFQEDQLEATEEKKDYKTPTMLDDMAFEDSSQEDLDFGQRAAARAKSVQKKKSSLWRETEFDIDERDTRDNRPQRGRRTSVKFESRKSILKGGEDPDKKLRRKMLIEESMVMHYITICLRLCKLTDAFKAINEYRTKPRLSPLAQAHLYQYEGCLSLIHCKNSFEQAERYFIDAIKWYEEINCQRGVAVCRLALLWSDFSQVEHRTDRDTHYPIKLCNQILKLKETFEAFELDLGIKCAERLLQDCSKFYDKANSGKKEKFTRLKTLTGSEKWESTYQGKTLKDLLLAEINSQLFTSVIEKVVLPKKKLKSNKSHLDLISQLIQKSKIPL